jgi:hypothetical protein
VNHSNPSAKPIAPMIAPAISANAIVLSMTRSPYSFRLRTPGFYAALHTRKMQEGGQFAVIENKRFKGFSSQCFCVEFNTAWEIALDGTYSDGEILVT